MPATPMPSLLNPPLTDERMSAFEATLPAPLPPEFRELLKRYNGARFGKCSTGLRDGRGDEVFVKELLGLHDEAWAALAWGGDPDVPEGLLLIAEGYATSCAFALQLEDREGSPAGAVWFLDAYAEHEDPDDAALYVASVCAPSIGAFLDRLVPEPDELPGPVAERAAAESPWDHPERLEKAPPDAPTRERPLVLAGHGRAVQRATLSITVTAAPQDPVTFEYLYDPARAVVRYGIVIDVDDSSGEDGMPAPEAQEVPVAVALGRHPRPSDWEGLEVGSDGWEAWYGNDAPALEENRLSVRSPLGPSMEVRWTARYSEFGRSFDFVYEGPLAFEGVRLAARKPDDVLPILRRAFGASFEPAEWELRLEPTIEIDGEPWHPALAVPRRG